MRSKLFSPCATACAIALASTLALPVMAQSSGSAGTTGTSGATGLSGSGDTTGTTGSSSTSRSPAPTDSASAATRAAGSRMGSDTDDNRGFDWGWLGLLGLAGLMGMRRSHDPIRPETPRPATNRS